MPKSKPTQVIVHRIELGQYERDAVKPLLEANAQQGNIKATAMTIGAVGLGFAAYTFYKWGKTLTGWTEGVVEDLKGWKDDLFLFGDNEAANNTYDPTDGDSFGFPFQILFGKGGQSPNGNDVNILGLPGWGIWPGVL